MSLRDIFIINLKKFRKKGRISQMKLAEKCNTAASYIGEIEIGRKFPSVEMIEKIAHALEVEPYRFFVDETSRDADNARAKEVFSSLPPEVLQHLIAGITGAVSESLNKALGP
jgi:transcriptional regulator with XRE-family HTH domain